MGIETLNKAAAAAGFAMAAPDEDTLSDARTYQPSQLSASKAVAIVQRPSSDVSPHVVRAAVTSAANWVKGVVPNFGGRAPA